LGLTYEGVAPHSVGSPQWPTARPRGLQGARLIAGGEGGPPRVQALQEQRLSPMEAIPVRPGPSGDTGVVMVQSPSAAVAAVCPYPPASTKNVGISDGTRLIHILPNCGRQTAFSIGYGGWRPSHLVRSPPTNADTRTKRPHLRASSRVPPGLCTPDLEKRDAIRLEVSDNLLNCSQILETLRGAWFDTPLAA